MPTFCVDDPACLPTFYVENPACLPTFLEAFPPPIRKGVKKAFLFVSNFLVCLNLRELAANLPGKILAGRLHRLHKIWTILGRQAGRIANILNIKCIPII